VTSLLLASDSSILKVSSPTESMNLANVMPQTLLDRSQLPSPSRCNQSGVVEALHLRP